MSTRVDRWISICPSAGWPCTGGRYGAAVTGFTRRLPWASLDVTVRAVVEETVLASVGSAIQDARDVHGGMSPGPAAVLTTADGQQVFVKITSSELNERSYELYGRCKRPTASPRC